MSQSRRSQSLPPNLPPRLVRRIEAASYLGIGATLFDQLVKEGKAPAPKMLESVKLWDIKQLDALVDDLPTRDAANPWDA